MITEDISTLAGNCNLQAGRFVLNLMLCVGYSCLKPCLAFGSSASVGHKAVVRSYLRYFNQLFRWSSEGMWLLHCECLMRSVELGFFDSFASTVYAI
jgi:hypothetical protein